MFFGVRYNSLSRQGVTMRALTHGQYGQLWEKMVKFAKCVDNGQIPLAKAMMELQFVIDQKRLKRTDSLDATVDYSRSFSEMILATGCLFNPEEMTPEHFPIKGEGKQQKKLHIVHFVRPVHDDAILCEISSAGYELGRLEDLIAVWDDISDNQLPLVAPGSVWMKERYGRTMPYRSRPSNGKCNLSVRHLHNTWDEFWHFLVIREPK